MVNTAAKLIKRKSQPVHQPIYAMEVQSQLVVSVAKIMPTQNAHSEHVQITKMLVSNFYFNILFITYFSLVTDACGEMFPFGLDSVGSRSIIETLYNNHNYRTQITDTGKQEYTMNYN